MRSPPSLLFLTLSFALPTTLAFWIETNISNTTTLLCSTHYATASLKGRIPRTTATQEAEDIEIAPVVLHETLTPTTTVTPTAVITTTTVVSVNTTYEIFTDPPEDGVVVSTSTVYEIETCESTPLLCSTLHEAPGKETEEDKEETKRTSGKNAN